MITIGIGRRAAALVAVLLLSILPCAAQDGLAAKVDEYIRGEMEKQRIPGMSLVILRDGQIVHAKGYGLSNVEHRVAVKPETIFQSGSVGKQFTAAAVMLLVEDGKVGLDDRIPKYFPDAPAHWKNITVRHLLTHTAGTTDYPPNFDFRRDYTEDELLKRAAEIPLAFQPGERWSYSNMGYVMLGILISKATGKFYGEFLRERVFTPLGMSTARIITEEEIIPNRSSGYRLAGGQLKHQEWVSRTMNTTADGSLYLTIYDMAKWDAALNGEKLLKRSSLDQIWTPVKLNNGKTYPYGFGWTLREANGHRLIEHGGAWQGFKSFIARYADEKLTVALFANLAQTNPDRIAHGVAVLCDPRLIAADDAAKGPRISAMLKDVLTKSMEGAADSAPFTPEARAILFPEKIKQIGASLKPLGAITGLGPAGRMEDDGIHTFFRYRIVFNDKSMFCRLAVTRDEKIAGLELSEK
ncbi:MAG: serine hydrolase domain-containing protein [Blastocatellia bacterium]